MPFISLFELILFESNSVQMINKYGNKGKPCLTPFSILRSWIDDHYYVYTNLHLYKKDQPNLLQERPLMQSIKGRRLIVYACVICWTTRNNQGQSPLSL